MFILGLTGPTGAGKSVAARFFSQRGYAVVDADTVARAVVEPGKPCLKELADAFGNEILLPDGGLDRRRLGGIVFSDSVKLERLNAITHPHIMADIEKRLNDLAQAGQQRAVLDAPALFEAGADRLCDRIVAVIAPKELCLKRIIGRDGITPDQARARVEAQPSRDFYTARADYIIDSTSEEEALSESVRKLAEELETESRMGQPPG